MMFFKDSKCSVYENLIVSRETAKFSAFRRPCFQPCSKGVSQECVVLLIRVLLFTSLNSPLKRLLSVDIKFFLLQYFLQLLNFSVI